MIRGKMERAPAVNIEAVDAWSRASVRGGKKEAEKLQGKLSEWRVFDSARAAVLLGTWEDQRVNARYSSTGHGVGKLKCRFVGTERGQYPVDKMQLRDQVDDIRAAAY